MSEDVINGIVSAFAESTGYSEDPIHYTAASPSEQLSGNIQLQELQQMYIPEPGLIYPFLSNSTAKFGGSMIITIGDNLTVELPTSELWNPVRGLAPDGSRMVNTNFSELAVYQTPAPENAAVLGKSFMSQIYLYVDYSKNEFSLALSNAGNGAPSVMAIGDEEGVCNTKGLDPAQKGEVAIGVVLALVLLVVAGTGIGRLWASLSLWRKRRAKRRVVDGDRSDESRSPARGRDTENVSEIRQPSPNTVTFSQPPFGRMSTTRPRSTSSA